MKLAEYSPTLRWVLLQAVVEEKTKGGIYVPSSVSASTAEYEVLEVGSRSEADLKAGDRVTLDPRVSPMSIRLEVENNRKEEFWLIQDTNIIGRARPK